MVIFIQVIKINLKLFVYVRFSYQVCKKILRMLSIENHIVEEAILKEIESLKILPTVSSEAEVNLECKPGVIGIRSMTLVDVMGKLEDVLNIKIPNSCYIFRDKDGITEFTIKQAAEKLIKIATHAE